jgi:hypothetical protein
MVGLTALGFALAEVISSAAPSSPVRLSVVFAVWTTSPVLLWIGWGITFAAEGKPHRSAVAIVGAVLLPTFVGLHLLVASRESSMSGLAYLLLPLFGLFLVLIAAGIAGGLAVRAVDLQRPEDPELKFLGEFEDRIDDLRRH